MDSDEGKAFPYAPIGSSALFLFPPYCPARKSWPMRCYPFF